MPPEPTKPAEAEELLSRSETGSHSLLTRVTAVARYFAHLESISLSQRALTHGSSSSSSSDNDILLGLDRTLTPRLMQAFEEQNDLPTAPLVFASMSPEQMQESCESLTTQAEMGSISPVFRYYLMGMQKSLAAIANTAGDTELNADALKKLIEMDQYRLEELKRSTVLANALLEMQEITLESRYGDYHAKLYNAMKHAVKQSKEHKSNLVRTAMEIHQKLEMETNGGPTTAAVRAAAKVLNIHLDTAKCVVREYALRNTTAHNGLEELISNKDWPVLAGMLGRDRGAIRHGSIAARDPSYASEMDCVIDWIGRCHFDILKPHANIPNFWHYRLLAMPPTDKEAWIAARERREDLLPSAKSTFAKIPLWKAQWENLDPGMRTAIKTLENAKIELDDIHANEIIHARKVKVKAMACEDACASINITTGVVPSRTDS